MQHLQPPMPPPPPQTPEYATFWARFWALVVDSLILAPLWVIGLVVFFSRVWPRMIDAIERGGRFRTLDPNDFYLPEVVGWFVLASAVTYLYNALMVAYKGATVGKMALGLRVLRSDGAAAGWREALLRPILQTALSLLSGARGLGALGLLDYLWMLWDGQRQTLHDKIAGTIVVKQRG